MIFMLESGSLFVTFYNKLRNCMILLQGHILIELLRNCPIQWDITMGPCPCPQWGHPWRQTCLSMIPDDKLDRLLWDFLDNSFLELAATLA